MTSAENGQLQRLYENSTVMLANAVEQLSAVLHTEVRGLEERLTLLAAQAAISDDEDGSRGAGAASAPAAFQWAKPAPVATVESLVRLPAPCSSAAALQWRYRSRPAGRALRRHEANEVRMAVL